MTPLQLPPSAGVWQLQGSSLLQTAPKTQRPAAHNTTHTHSKVQREPSGLMAEQSSGSVDGCLLLAGLLRPVCIMGLTRALPALPPARVMAVTSPKHLHPADEDHVHCRYLFTPVGVQWGLKDSEWEWLNGNIASHNAAQGNLWLVGQSSAVPCDRAGSACQPSCLPHPALKGRDVLRHLDEEGKQPLMHSEVPLLPHKGSVLVPPEDILPMSLKLSTAFTQQPT